MLHSSGVYRRSRWVRSPSNPWPRCSFVKSATNMCFQGRPNRSICRHVYIVEITIGPDNNRCDHCHPCRVCGISRLFATEAGHRRQVKKTTTNMSSRTWHPTGHNHHRSLPLAPRHTHRGGICWCSVKFFRGWFASSSFGLSAVSYNELLCSSTIILCARRVRNVQRSFIMCGDDIPGRE